jgi:hypothetical protein
MRALQGRQIKEGNELTGTASDHGMAVADGRIGQETKGQFDELCQTLVKAVSGIGAVFTIRGRDPHGVPPNSSRMVVWRTRVATGGGMPRVEASRAATTALPTGTRFRFSMTDPPVEAIVVAQVSRCECAAIHRALVSDGRSELKWRGAPS